MTYCHYHIFLLDKIFIVLIPKLVGDFSTARIGESLARCHEFIENNLANTRASTATLCAATYSRILYLCSIGRARGSAGAG